MSNPIFHCPNCRCTQFEPVVLQCAECAGSVTGLFSCVTCTQVFLDAMAMTRGFADRPLTAAEQATARFVTTQSASPLPYADWARINQAKKDRSTK